MAPIPLNSVSSNWKKLQKTLQSSKSSSSPSSKPTISDQPNTLKRKRSIKLNDEQQNGNPHPRKPLNNDSETPKKPIPVPKPETKPRKRQKMEEPRSIGSSVKHHDTKTLTKSVSMPTLKPTPLLTNPKSAAQAISVLSPSPDFPDNENEGISPRALPGKYIALDCEMVGTGPQPDRDSALARVSVVNFHGHQVYDSYVQVSVPVTDYRSAVSGIEPRHLRSATARTFKEVRADLEILLRGRVLVGHAVKNDLDALVLKHDKRCLRDTSKFSKFRELAPIPGRTPSLRVLAEKLLGVEIQVGAHSSVEDARATMALFRLEKEGFDREVLARYGHIRVEGGGQDAGADAMEVGGGAKVKRKSNNRKRKKKKN